MASRELSQSARAVTRGQSQPAEPLPGDYMSVPAPRPWSAWNRGIGWEVNDATGEPINNGFRETFTQGDARLISAAPDMLEALEALAEDVCDYARINSLGDPEQKHNVKLARAAISKARGS